MLTLRRRCQLLPMVAGIAACHSIQSLGVPEPNMQLEANPQVVSVTRRDQSVLTIYRPTVKGDSLVGWLDKPADDALNARPVAVSLSDVRDISVRKIDATATAFAFGAGVIAAVVFFALLFIATFEGS